jgi:3-oxoacyl-[acyl-carrier-protein] synthase II
LNAQGPNANFTAACVSSAKAIGEAAEAIRREDADVMLCGGAHSMIHPFGITGFQRLSTLSTWNGEPQQASRPFDLRRDGFVVGEGGTVLVLEDLDHARKRGAEIGEQLAGGTAQTRFDHGFGADGRAGTLHDLPGGRRPVPGRNDYINAHGSGTAVNDRVETLATKRAFGSQPTTYPFQHEEHDGPPDDTSALEARCASWP